MGREQKTDPMGVGMKGITRRGKSTEMASLSMLMGQCILDSFAKAN